MERHSFRIVSGDLPEVVSENVLKKTCSETFFSLCSLDENAALHAF